ncbi:MAG TPA: DUF6510 family protein [Hyphomicrobiaceae bacterium]|jgi:hypothetical protein|nr:DUF6510 family protein [Hyphomicrobiaceae bacterium]
MNPDESAMPAAPLDGNAAAGLLQEVFVFDATSATLTCDGCGATAEVGAARLYGAPMGAVLRCRDCDAALLRIARTPMGLWLDLKGSRSLMIRLNGGA